MDELSNGEGAGGNEPKQASPVRESRLATLRRTDSVVQGGYSPSGRTSPTLLQRSNSMSADKAAALWSHPQQQQSATPRGPFRSPSSPRPQSPHPRSPRALPPDSSLPELLRGSPRLRSISGKYAFDQLTRSGTFSKKARGRLLKRGGALFFLALFFWFALDWWYLSSLQQLAPQPLEPVENAETGTVSPEV